MRSLDVKKMADIILRKQEETSNIVDTILNTDNENEDGPSVKKSKPKITATKLKKDKIIIQKVPVK